MIIESEEHGKIEINVKLRIIYFANYNSRHIFNDFGEFYTNDNRLWRILFSEEEVIFEIKEWKEVIRVKRGKYD